MSFLRFQLVPWLAFPSAGFGAQSRNPLCPNSVVVNGQQIDVPASTVLLAGGFYRFVPSECGLRLEAIDTPPDRPPLPSGPLVDCVFPIHCRDECEWIFDRVLIYPLVVGGTRVEWNLHPRFSDPGPYIFQLQYSPTGTQEADDWESVGLPSVNSYYAYDDVQRLYGKSNWVHYRVTASTPLGIYVSKPQRATGVLRFRDWMLAREILRMERLRLRLAAGQEGYILKAKNFGEVHEPCVDSITDEVTNSTCNTCYGTGFVGGYFEPTECSYAELPPTSSHVQLDATRGTVDDEIRVAARMLAIPRLMEGDVWIDRDTDHRWAVHSITNLVEMRGVPLISSVELRLIPFSNVIYQFAIPNQIPV